MYHYPLRLQTFSTKTDRTVVCIDQDGDKVFDLIAPSQDITEKEWNKHIDFAAKKMREYETTFTGYTN